LASGVGTGAQRVGRKTLIVAAAAAQPKKDPAFLKWYREAELIHGRWAMAAVLGIFAALIVKHKIGAIIYGGVIGWPMC
jgi:light-harvesting complex II chlorophyll a/b binding protein 6